MLAAVEMIPTTCLTPLLWLSAVTAQSTAAVVHIDPVPRQTLTSFGASGAWWPNDLIHFPAQVQKQLGDFLFSEDGLYLSSYRYNMGGDGGDDTQQVTANGSRVESFLLRNGSYDWSRDHAGVVFLRMAQQYAVPYITFFINAAPSHIATNGAACGWNMTSNKVMEFADYVSTVLSHWVAEGVDVKYISPMNEPDNNRADCGQEGMAVSPSLRSSVFKAIKSVLSTSAARKVNIIGDETSQITTQAFPEDPVWLPSSAPVLSSIAVHNYDYPNDTALAEYYTSLQHLTKHHTPAVKFTETCCSTNAGSGSSVFGAQYDPTMANALIVARYIWQFLTIVQAESFDWWTAVTYLPCSPKLAGPQCARQINETAGYNSGLVYIDPSYNQTHDYTLYMTKRAYMLKHFAYFHRPGSVRYDIAQTQLPAGVNAIASTASDTSGQWGYHNGGWYGDRSNRKQVWNVLFMNHETYNQDFLLAVPARGAYVSKIVQTTNTEDWEEVTAKPAVRNGVVRLSLPPQSLLTVQFVS